MPPLLSHVMVGRNDDYLGNFKRRLEMSVNYTCRSVAGIGELANFEFLICDWNSDTPLRYALNLNEDARKCVRFLEVAPSLVQKHDKSSVRFNQPLAVNAAMRRARGDFLVFTPADVFFAAHPMRALFSLLRNKREIPGVHDFYLGIERRLIPWQISERITPDKLDAYLMRHASLLELEGENTTIPFGEGGFVLSRSTVEITRGYNESFTHWGVHETELARRVAQFAPILKGTHAGIFCYDFQQRPRLRDSLVTNTDKVAVQSAVNSENWGLGEVDIPSHPAGHCPDVVHPEEPPPPYDIDSASVPLRHIRPRKRQVLRALLRYNAFRSLCWHASAVSFAAARMVKKHPPRSLALETVLATWLAGGDGSWSLGKWYGDPGTLRDYILTLFDKRIYRKNLIGDFRDACNFVATLATLGRARPARFFFAPLRMSSVAQAAASVDPTIDVTGYDHWCDCEKKDINGFYWAMQSRKSLGSNHILTGELSTMFERLRSIPFAREPYQALFLDLAFLQPITGLLKHELASIADDQCVIIVNGDVRSIENFIKDVEPLSFAHVAAMPGLAVLQRFK